MKGIASKIPKALPSGARLLCDDNSGAKIVQIIGMIGIKGRKGRYPFAGVSDRVAVSVKKGNPEMIGKVEHAIIIRQKRPIKRISGLRVMFEDNAVSLVDEQGLPKGTEIKGVIAREVAERYPKVSAIASAII